MSIYKKMGAPSTEQVVSVIIEVKIEQTLDLPGMYIVKTFLDSDPRGYKTKDSIDSKAVESLEALYTTKQIEGMNEGVYLAINNSILDKRNNLVNLLPES